MTDGVGSTILTRLECVRFLLCGNDLRQFPSAGTLSVAKRKPAANRSRDNRVARPAKAGGKSAPSKKPAGKPAAKVPGGKSAPARSGRPRLTGAKSGKPSAGGSGLGPAKTTMSRKLEGAGKVPAVAKKPTPEKKPVAREEELLGQVETAARAPRSGGGGKNGRSLAVEAPEVEKPLRKTPLTDAELAEFRELLLAKRRELVGDMNNMSDEARRTGAPAGTISSMPIHMADLGTDTWEQELTLGLIENERGLLREIDEALKRIDDKTYGICVAMNKPIGKARLRFKPWAKHCIEYARKMEQGR